MDKSSRCTEPDAQGVWFEKATTAGHSQAAYFARHLKGNNFIGFRNDVEHQLVIANKLRFALTFQEPVGLLFRNASERNAYLQNLRGEVKR